jgi:hypothetical protein
VTVDIFSNTKCPNTKCSYFYDFLGVVLWALIFSEEHFIRKKIVDGPRVSVSSQNKNITDARPPDPTPNKCDAGSLTIAAYDNGPFISISMQTVHGILKIFHLY